MSAPVPHSGQEFGYRTVHNGQSCHQLNLQNAPGSITLAADIWTSVANDSYLELTAHFVDSDWVMQHLTLTVEPLSSPHTGTVLKDTIMEILDEFGIAAKLHA